MIEDPLWPRADAWLARNDSHPKLAVVGVPTSVASLSPSKAYQTPRRVRAILGRLSTFHSEHGIDLDSLAVADRGDWEVASLGMEECQTAIDTAARDLPPGPVYAFLGGDNAITRPLARGLSLGKLDELGVLTFDAHHDVRTLDRGATNGTPIRGLIEDGLPDNRVIQVGIHSFSNSAAYRAYCDQHGIRSVTMEAVDMRGIGPVVKDALAELGERAEWVYVDFDIDVLDRAFAPACAGSRPGGMTPCQLATAAWMCGRHPQVRAADFVEVDASVDLNDLTLMNMATVFLNFASGVAVRRQKG